MGVGAWGYGTGATTAAAHPFSLCIQGIDVIHSVPMESISVSTSLDSNATLRFQIADLSSTAVLSLAVAIPAGFADVVFTDHTNGDVIFSGLVISAKVSSAVLGRVIEVSCVDYGFLLDKTPVSIDLTGVDYAHFMWRPAYPAGLTACEGVAYSFWSNSGRFGLWPRYANYTIWGTTSGSYVGSVRGFLESPSIESLDSAPWFIFVDPLRRVNFWSAWALTVDEKAAPYNVVRASPGGGETAVENLSVEYEYTQSETKTWMDDQSVANDDGWVVGDLTATNGYAIGTGSVSLHSEYMVLSLGSPYNVSFDGPRTAAAFYHLRQLKGEGPTVRGSFTWEGTVNWEIADVFTITDAAQGLSAEKAFVYSVTTRFLGGDQRRCDVAWSLVPVVPVTQRQRRAGGHPTASKYNRTRFVRAGVTT